MSAPDTAAPASSAPEPAVPPSSSPPSSTPQPAPPEGIDRFSDVPAWLATLWILGLLAYTIAGRITFPYDLEWMEGGMLMHAWRVLHGESLYVVPTSEFVPFIYPPLYHWLVAALGSLVGFGYPAARAISVVGTLVTAACATAAARQEGVRWGLAVAAGGLFLSTFEDTGAFFDLTRIDGLFMALTTGALVAGRGAAWRTSGVLLTLAFATKHNAALFGLPILIWAYRHHGRAAAQRFAAWSVGPALTFTVLVTAFEGDRLFLTYILGVPGTHGFLVKRLLWVTHKEVFLALPFTSAVLLGMAAWWGARRARGAPMQPLRPGTQYWLWNGGLALLLSAVMRGHQGGFTNVLMPGMWAASLGGVLVLSHLRTLRPHRALTWGLPLLLAGQLVAEDWNPERFRASETDWEAGARLKQAIADEPGEVLAPWSPWVALEAGKKPSFHLIGLWDIDHTHGPLVEHVATVRADVEAHRWDAILVMDERQMPPGIKQFYRRKEPVVPGGPSLRPKTGWRIRPKNFWRPRVVSDQSP